MENTSINELNTFLKGEYMAIDSYERYIQTVKEPAIKGELQKIQKEHKQHAIQISERIQNLGGKPADSPGIAGRVAETISGIKDIGNKSYQTILKEAYNGEDKGIKMADELVKGDLDSESKNLVNNILNTDRTHLNTLDTLITH